MSSWTPVVYAPTYKMDFRLLTAPHALAHGQGRKWLLSLLVPTLHAPEQLRGAPRWAIFQDSVWRIFGVACMASELVNKSEPRVKDQHGRPTYLFVGYAAHKAIIGGFPSSARCDSNLAIFASLYKYVLLHWNDVRQGASEAGAEYALDFGGKSSQKGNAVQLNGDNSRVALWPDTRQTRAQLWQAVINYTQPISLLLGFASQQYAQQTPYINGTSEGVRSVTVLAKSS